MKPFVAALIMLSLIAGLCIWGTTASTRIIDELLDELHRTPTDSGSIPENALEVSEAILSIWEEKFFIISMLHPHAYLDETKEKMIALCSYADTDAYDEWAEAHANLEASLLHLRNLLQANADNIL